jgi:hypothetical protein
MDLRWMNGAVAGAALGLLAMSETTHVARVTAPDDGQLATLERHAAGSPDDIGSLTELAGAYLDRGEPGMALAALARPSPQDRQRPEVLHVAARALFEDGRAKDALAMELRALDACAEAACRPRLLAQGARRVEFFQAVIDLGVENPLLAPDTVALAFERSNREVRLQLE